MKRLLALLACAALCTGVAGQTTPTTDTEAAKEARNKAKQEMVNQATEGTRKPSGASKSTTSSHAKKLTKEQKKKAMEGVSKSAGSQYGPSAAAQAEKIDPNAPKAAKPDMSDPNVRDAMQKQKR